MRKPLPPTQPLPPKHPRARPAIPNPLNLKLHLPIPEPSPIEMQQHHLPHHLLLVLQRLLGRLGLHAKPLPPLRTALCPPAVLGALLVGQDLVHAVADPQLEGGPHGGATGAGEGCGVGRVFWVFAAVEDGAPLSCVPVWDRVREEVRGRGVLGGCEEVFAAEQAAVELEGERRGLLGEFASDWERCCDRICGRGGVVGHDVGGVGELWWCCCLYICRRWGVSLCCHGLWPGSAAQH